jgi:hypothetical protein
MIRGLFFVGLACGIAAPALAGERNAAAMAGKLTPPTLPVLAAANPVPAPGAAKPLTLPKRPVAAEFVVTVQAIREPSLALAAFENRIATWPVAAAKVQSLETVKLASPFSLAAARTPIDWRLAAKLPQVTASANGIYAVRDILGEYRKPRLYRQTALSTMLMLRIDGKDDTPAFGVGGGGVAAVLWKVMPQ